MIVVRVLKNGLGGNKTMRPESQKKFAFLMLALAEVFDSGNVPSPAKTEIYFKALVDYSIDSIARAVDEIIKTRIFATFPKPAEIIQAIEGDGNEKTILAWGKLDRAVRQIGSYQSVQFDDPVIHSVVKFLGGWEKICQVTEDEWKWKQKEFERLYLIMAKRGNHPEYLIGITEWQNMVDYLDDIPDVVRIGFFPKENKHQIEDTRGLV